MKMKRFVTAAVALLLMVSMVGTGFSYWFFNQNKATASQDMGDLTVEQYIKVGSVSKAPNFGLKFDQTTSGRETANSAKVADLDTPTGITLVWDKAATETGTKHTADYTPSTDPAFDYKEGVVTYVFTTSITISKDLAGYIDVTCSDTSWTKTPATTPEEPSEDVTITFTKEYSGTGDAIAFDWEQVSFTYKGDKEPQSENDYLKFRAIVLGDDTYTKASISVSYEVTLKGLATANSGN